ncbi:MAG TPA: cellulose binding domain-containing protein, partial [Actinocrinis sp.]|uniref:cellulose binding domain-containing protein n=1 Tax=Actinocrinis sp. TaxID=1920516 RepID=UPI002DDCD38F
MQIQRRALSAIGAAAALLAAGVAAVALPTQASAAAGCSVSYTIASDWGTGFSTNIVITNLGSPITS